MKRSSTITNADIAAYLIQEGENASGVLAKALKRAARSALLWPEEAADLLGSGRKLTELHGVGPHLSKLITAWMSKPPAMAGIPPLQREFLTLAEARRVIAKNQKWCAQIKGDLQMHTTWSDG